MRVIQYNNNWEVENGWLKLYQNNNVNKSEDGESLKCRSAPAWWTDLIICHSITIQRWCTAETEYT